LAPDVGHGVRQIIHKHRWVGRLPLAEQIVRHDPIILTEVYGNDGNIQNAVVPRQPFDEAVIQRAMRIKEQQAALAPVPLLDVLADYVLQKLRLAGSRASADIQVLGTLGSGKGKDVVSPGKLTENEIVARIRLHDTATIFAKITAVEGF
jgi:hypothetical protein